MACVSESARRNAKQLRPYAGRGAGGGCGCAATPPHEIIALTGPHPMRMASIGAQDLRLALDVSDCDEIDIELRVLALEGTGPAVTISIETGMQCDTDHGWVTLATFPAVSVAPGMHIRRLRGFLRYLRWNVTTLSGSGQPAATFLIDGVARAWGHEHNHFADAVGQLPLDFTAERVRGSSRGGFATTRHSPPVGFATKKTTEAEVTPTGGTGGANPLQPSQAEQTPPLEQVPPRQFDLGNEGFAKAGDAPPVGEAPSLKFSYSWRTWTAWHWNVAGDKWHKGRTWSGMVDRAVSSIVHEDADFATFNELCRTQFEAIKEALIDHGWPDDPAADFAVFYPTAIAAHTPAIHCGVPWVGEAGEAIFSKRPLGPAVSVGLEYDGKPICQEEHRVLLCAPLRDLPWFRICTTHLSWVNCSSKGTGDDPFPGFPGCTEVQLDQIRAVLDAFGGTWILSADLNASLGMLREYYSPNVRNHYTGRYRELDDLDLYANHALPGEITGLGHRDKIDYMFVPEDKVAPWSTYDMDAFEPPYTCLTPGHPDSFNNAEYTCLREDLRPIYALLEALGYGYYWGPLTELYQCCSDHTIIVGHVTLTQ